MSVVNQIIAKTLPFVPKSIVGRVSRKYIAGVALDDAVRVVRDLNSQTMMATLDILGEDILEREPAIRMVTNWKKVIKRIKEHALDSNISIKLSQLGLRIDRDLCYQNVRSILQHAHDHQNFVRIDMEDSSTTDGTLDIYRRLRSDGFRNVGVVIQAYLRRSEQDVKDLLKLNANFRLCKGIYIESPTIAFKQKEEIRKNFVLLMKLMLENGSYIGIATHDEYLIDEAYTFLEREKFGREKYEFQMLLGVRERLRDSIVNAGHRLRVYVPFGEKWYAYSVRRLKENPQIAGYVWRSMFGFNRFG